MNKSLRHSFMFSSLISEVKVVSRKLARLELFFNWLVDLSSSGSEADWTALAVPMPAEAAQLRIKDETICELKQHLEIRTAEFEALEAKLADITLRSSIQRIFCSYLFPRKDKGKQRILSRACLTPFEYLYRIKNTSEEEIREQLTKLMGQIKEVRDDNDKLEQENLDLKVIPNQDKILIVTYFK